MIDFLFCRKLGNPVLKCVKLCSLLLYICFIVQRWRSQISTRTLERWVPTNGVSLSLCLYLLYTLPMRYISSSLRARCHTGATCRSWPTCRTTYRRTWPFQRSRRTVTVLSSSTARVRCSHSTTASTTAASSTPGTVARSALITRRLYTVHAGHTTSHSSFPPSSAR